MHLVPGCIIVILWLIVSANGLSALEREYISNDELIAALNSGDVDRIRDTVNSIKQMRYKGEIIPLVHRLWDGTAEPLYELRQDILDLPIVRMEFANILLQAQKNNEIDIETGVIRNEVLSNIEKDDVALVRLSIENLSILDDERDVDLVKEIAEQRNRATFRSAVLALATMCSLSAREALRELELDTTNVSERSFIESTRSSMDSIRDDWCREF